MNDHTAIFDLDGTLVDSIDDIAASLNHALEHEALPTHTRSAVARMVGDGVKILVQRASSSADEDTQLRLLERFAEHYAVHCVDRSTLYPGVDAMLNRLTAADWRLAVLSNKPDTFTQTCTTALLSRWPFQVILGARDGIPKKPDPEAALEIASLLGAEPARTHFIGDGTADIATGHRAGMRTIAVTWGYRDAQTLAACNPDAMVSTPDELANLLLENESPGNRHDGR